MKTPWEVSRTLIACPDGQRRWDYAYQFLLRWAMENDSSNRQGPLFVEHRGHQADTIACYNGYYYTSSLKVPGCRMRCPDRPCNPVSDRF